MSLATGVFYRHDAGGGVFLNTATNKLLSIDKIGDLIVTLCLEGHSPEIIKDALAEKYPAKQNDVALDVDEFIDELLSNHLFVNSTSPSPGHKVFSNIAFIFVRTFLWGTAIHSMKAASAKLYLRLTILSLCLTSGSFELIRRVIAEYPQSAKADNTSPNSVVNALKVACKYYPTQVLCLQQSAVLALSLRDLGHNAELVLGTMKYPFKAHAWVEIDGELIGEMSSFQKSLTEIARI